jgi:hypothetical protein
MKKLFLILLIAPVLGFGQTIFTKNPNTDSSLPENQDRISATVWLTRGNQRGIYNAYDQSSAKNQPTSGIKLALGNTENISTLNFETISKWGKKFNEVDGVWFNENLVLYLTETNQYYDFMMTSWKTNGSFSYTRSSTALSITDYSNTITIYPNPTSSIIIIEQDFTTAKVYDISGRELLKSTSKTIDLSELPSNIYLLRLYDSNNGVLGTGKIVKN